MQAPTFPRAVLAVVAAVVSVGVLGHATGQDHQRAQVPGEVDGRVTNRPSGARSARAGTPQRCARPGRSRTPSSAGSCTVSPAPRRITNSTISSRSGLADIPGRYGTSGSKIGQRQRLRIAMSFGCIGTSARAARRWSRRSRKCWQSGDRVRSRRASCLAATWRGKCVRTGAPAARLSEHRQRKRDIVPRPTALLDRDRAARQPREDQ